MNDLPVSVIRAESSGAEGSSPAVDRLERFAAQQDLAILPSRDEVSAHHFSLGVDQGRIALYPPPQLSALGHHPLVIDFVADPRFSRPLTRKDPLARATGWKAGYRPWVIDLTAGLGRDAWALASGGCQVVAVERHPVVWLLLEDALQRAAVAEVTRQVAARITLVATDALGEALCPLPGAEPPVWYLDPMFPERRKSALVKKPMRIFHHLVGEDPDADELFRWARRQAGRRWVVKRPSGAPALAREEPDVHYGMKRLRFDCYLTQAPSPGDANP
ncbi:MAG: class I SAM-dependent methyltransferase [Halothiobacillaceae bacterium]